MSWGSSFQAETAATTKVRSPIEEGLVAGMINSDDAAEHRCFRPATSSRRRTLDEKYPGAFPLMH